MSSKSTRLSPHSSPKRKARTHRFALASACLVAFLAGTFLQGCVSNQQRNRETETAKRARDNSSETSLADSKGGTKKAPKSDLQEGTSEVSNRKESLRPQERKPASAKLSTQGIRIDKNTAISAQNSGESSSKAQASPVNQPEEKRQLATQEKSDTDKATSELQPDKRSAASVSAINSDDRSRDRDLKAPGGGRRMRLPGGVQETDQLNSQGGQASTEAAITSGPEVVQLIGPVSQDEDLRKLPYIPPTASEEEETRLKRHPDTNGHGVTDPIAPFNPPSLPASMPSPVRNFDGVTAVTSGSNLIPPDTDGDVGPNHYIQSVNSSIQIFSKTGTTISGPTTFNSFFSALGPSTPCGTNQNEGDGVVLYDHLANRWVVTDFAFTSLFRSAHFMNASECQRPVIR